MQKQGVLSFAILAGGHGGRLKGLDKGLVKLLDGKTMVEHVINAVKWLEEEVLIVVHDEDQAERYLKTLERYRVKVVVDVLPTIRSPLVGVLTALKNSSKNLVMVLPCDTPFVSRSFVKFMVEKACSVKGFFNVLVPRWPNGWIEPLHAVYAKNISRVIEKVVRSGVLDFKSLTKKIPKKAMK